MRKSFFNSQGIVPLYLILAILGVIFFIMISATFSFKENLFYNLFLKPFSQAANSQGISIVDFAYQPKVVYITPNTTVTWINTSSVYPHTVTSDQGLFNSGTLTTAMTFNYTFRNLGTFTYHCIYHPEITGTIIVTNTLPTPSPNPTQTPTPSPTPVAVVQVAALDNFFQQSDITVQPNTRVTWTNNSVATPHTVTSTTGLFSSGNINPEQSFSYTFTNPGTYNYKCDYHQTMVGTVTVASASASPTPNPTACDVVYDVNCDGLINIFDLSILLTNYGKASTTSGFNPKADLNFDNLVNIFDLSILLSHYAN
jgi:plastocyanin